MCGRQQFGKIWWHKPNYHSTCVRNLAQILRVPFDLSFALRMPGLAGIDVKPQLGRETAVDLVDLAPAAAARRDRRLTGRQPCLRRQRRQQHLWHHRHRQPHRTRDVPRRPAADRCGRQRRRHAALRDHGLQSERLFDGDGFATDKLRPADGYICQRRGALGHDGLHRQ